MSECVTPEVRVGNAWQVFKLSIYRTVVERSEDGSCSDDEV